MTCDAIRVNKEVVSMRLSFQALKADWPLTIFDIVGFLS
jgi:hypothetical protein